MMWRGGFLLWLIHPIAVDNKRSAKLTTFQLYWAIMSNKYTQSDAIHYFNQRYLFANFIVIDVGFINIKIESSVPLCANKRFMSSRKEKIKDFVLFRFWFIYSVRTSSTYTNTHFPLWCEIIYYTSNADKRDYGLLT